MGREWQTQADLKGDLRTECIWMSDFCFMECSALQCGQQAQSLSLCPLCVSVILQAVNIRRCEPVQETCEDLTIKMEGNEAKPVLISNWLSRQFLAMLLGEDWKRQ